MGVRIVPTPEQLADVTLTEPFTGEVAFTRRLARLLGDSLDGTSQTALSTAVKTALVRSQIHALPEEQHALLSAPLHAVEPAVTAAPDVVLSDGDDRIVWVIEAKGRRTRTQWTQLRSVRQRPYADNPWSAFITTHAIAPCDPQWDAPHADDQPCGCRLKKDLGKGSHANGLHQGDAYLTFADWIPRGYSVHPDAVWTALLPSPWAVWEWRQHLISTDVWHLARLRAFHDHLAHLAGSGELAFTEWERHLLTHFIGGIHAYYDLATPSQYADDEWLTYGEPEELDPFQPDEAATARFAYAAWQDDPLDVATYRAHTVLVHGSVGDQDGYDDYLARHAEWRAAGGSGSHWHATAAQPEDMPAERAAVPPASRRAEVAKDVAKAAAFFAAGALMDHRARSQDRRAARANRPSAWDAAAGYIIDDRPKWQRDRDELTRLQLKQMRKRNGAWW